jgi:hypothetical protein
MQRRWLEMQDSWTLQPTKLDENKKHLFECKDNNSPTGHSLLVRLAATHSGRVNNNKRFYRPDKVQEATHTWLNKPTPCPVLVEHNKKGDVMGRVRSAKYIDETHKFDQDYPILRDTLFYNTDSATRISLKDSVEWIVDNLGPQEDFAGLGYIELGTQITNPEAIRKIFNDEFLNVSVGFATDSAICSICYTDWACDDKCNHKPGYKVDGKEAFLITGNLDYKEVSFVNFPADPFATKLSVEQFTDSLNKKFYLGLSVKDQKKILDDAGITLTDSLISYDDDIAITYEDSMDLNDFKLDSLDNFLTEIKSADLTAAKAFEYRDAVSSLQPESAEEKTKVRSFKSTLNARIKKENWIAAQESVIDAVTESEMASAFSDGTVELEVTAPVVETAAAWTYANADEEAYFQDSEGITTELTLTDSTYAITETTPDEAFCGPNKSFAVTDAATAATCKTVVDKAPLSPETKLKIQEAIYNREKTLGILTGADAEAFETLYTDAKKDIGEKVIGTYSDLHNYYTAADWDTRGKIRNLHEAVGHHFGAISHKERSEKALLTEGHNVNPYSDRVEKLAKPEFTDGDASESLILLDKLDKLYDAATEEVKPKLYSATQAIISDWSTDDYVRYAKAKLAECKDSYAVLPSIELAEKEDAINNLTTDKTELTAKLNAEKVKSLAFFNETKKSLATQIIMSKMIAGTDEYKGLTKEKLDEKITELSKRNIISLKDSVKDILIEQKFLISSSSEASELETRVAENMQVTDADTVSSSVLTDSKIAGDALEDQYIFASAAKYLSPSERARFFAEKRWSSK